MTLGFAPPAILPPGLVPARPLGHLPVTTQRYAVHGWTAAADDATPGQAIAGRLLPVTTQRYAPVSSAGLLAGLARVSAGELRLVNADGALDHVAERWSVEGAAARLRIARLSGRKRPRTVDMAVIWSGRAEAWQVDEDEVRIPTRDVLALLDRPMRVASYTGRGGLTGTAEMAGWTPPLGFGPVFNARPQLVDPDLLIYQLHAGRIRQLQAVRDMGVPLQLVGNLPDHAALRAASPEPGEAISCHALGLVRLGDFPEGDVTADFLGDGADPALAGGRWDDGRFWADGRPWDDGDLRSYVERPAALLLRLMGHYGGVPRDLFDLASFAEVDRRFPHALSWFVPAGGGAPPSVAEACAAICEAAGVVVAVSQAGQIYARLVTPPRGGYRIREADILSVKQVSLPHPGPIQRATVPYAPNWTTQDGAALVTPWDDAAAAELGRYGVAQGGTVSAGTGARLTRLQTLRAVALPEARLVTRAGAAARAQAILRTHPPGQRLLQVTTGRGGWRRNLLDPVVLEHARFAPGRGRPFLVTGYELRPLERTCTLDLLSF